MVRWAVLLLLLALVEGTVPKVPAALARRRIQQLLSHQLVSTPRRDQLHLHVALVPVCCRHWHPRLFFSKRKTLLAARTTGAESHAVEFTTVHITRACAALTTCTAAPTVPSAMIRTIAHMATPYMMLDVTLRAPVTCRLFQRSCVRCSVRV